MIERFIEFLKENNVYEQFKRNVINNRCKEEDIYNMIDGKLKFSDYLKEALKPSRPHLYASGLFVWMNTGEGWMFWNNIHSEWLKESKY